MNDFCFVFLVSLLFIAGFLGFLGFKDGDNDGFNY